LVVLIVLNGLQIAGTAYLLREFAGRWRRPIFTSASVSIGVLLLGFLLRFERFAHLLPRTVSSWARGVAMAWGLLAVLLLCAIAVSRRLERARNAARPGRRAFLRLTQAALFGGPAAVLGYGTFVQRFQLRLREQDIGIPNLAEDLHGLRLVQLTDIHLSPFLTEKELERAIAMANEAKAHIALVTGDLISTADDPLDACLAQVAKLRAGAGIFGCHGNHEIYGDAEAYATGQGARLGIRFLRRQAWRLRFGGATINIAGVDYQRFGKPYLTGVESLIDPDSFNVLLSHNPDVFPVAARKGFDLILSGHTHGGQVRVEILRQDLNVARFFTPYVDGLYTQDGSRVFVSRGIGTIAMPARLGAPPEVALIRLWRT
jgi:predicted MPP superfamily phosphohydrolase